MIWLIKPSFAKYRGRSQNSLKTVFYAIRFTCIDYYLKYIKLFIISSIFPIKFKSDELYTMEDECPS